MIRTTPDYRQDSPPCLDSDTDDDDDDEEEEEEDENKANQQTKIDADNQHTSSTTSSTTSSIYPAAPSTSLPSQEIPSMKITDSDSREERGITLEISHQGQHRCVLLMVMVMVM